ncbi:MAG: LPS export ABC transporter periplasmic protein LptC [Candidatus Solibacter usitatus]|nr:LPS export ABC transporter periplasmic protein LptC [Candidatus Solibacter usitatus]
MRNARWLLVLAILGIGAGIGITYRSRKADLEKHAATKPAELPFDLSGKLENWHWSHTDQGHPIVDIKAKGVKQENDSSKVLLDQVELRIFKKTGLEYDLVRSAQAEFDQSANRLYSSGQVDITLNLPVEGEPTRKPVTIRSSGVTFETKTGRANTEKTAHFIFENGEGDSMGAIYDPQTRELHLLSQVSLDWKAKTPSAKPMKIETAELNYKEGSSVIWLKPWARLHRDNAVMEAADTMVTLEGGAIHQVDAVRAHGTDEYPRRKLQYAADELRVTYDDDGRIDRVTGKNNAKLVSVAETSQTTMTTDVVYLDFETVNGDSNLKKVLGNGHTVVDSKPLPVEGEIQPETRVLRSETVEIRMRAGGREIERVLAKAPGNLEFLPNHPSQRRRTLDGDDMDIVYGAQNQIQSFRCVNARTRTEPNDAEKARKRAVSTTRSKNLAAEFEPKTGQMKSMQQWGDFTYEEGDRRAQSSRASLDYGSNLITLETKARMSDAAATTSADRIKLDEKTGDFTADGHVASSRMPDKKTTSSEMLSGDEPIQAVAEHMTAANHNRLIHYETRAVMWQGSSRVQGDRIDLDRDKRTLAAKGGVITNLMEKPKAAEGSDKPAADAAPIFTVVKADELLYTEQDRLAHYHGHVLLNRPNLWVKAGELRAYLSESKPKTPAGKTADADDDSRLEKAFADHQVEIVQTAPDRTRTGTADHAEYYTTGEERILLRGGEPQFVDSKRGNTRGAELTYFVNDDRLLVTGGPGARTASRLVRK